MGRLERLASEAVANAVHGLRGAEAFGPRQKLFRAHAQRPRRPAQGASLFLEGGQNDFSLRRDGALQQSGPLQGTVQRLAAHVR